jgi:hypothetical protein
VHGVHLRTDRGEQWIVRVFEPTPSGFVTSST